MRVRVWRNWVLTIKTLRVALLVAAVVAIGGAAALTANAASEPVAVETSIVIPSIVIPSVALQEAQDPETLPVGRLFLRHLPSKVDPTPERLQRFLAEGFQGRRLSELRAQDCVLNEPLGTPRTRGWTITNWATSLTLIPGASPYNGIYVATTLEPGNLGATQQAVGTYSITPGC